jgi:hypothetical protein
LKTRHLRSQNTAGDHQQGSSNLQNIIYNRPLLKISLVILVD